MMTGPIDRRSLVFWGAVFITTSSTGNGWIHQSAVTRTTLFQRNHPQQQNFDFCATKAPSSRQAVNCNNENHVVITAKEGSPFLKQITDLLLFAAWCFSLSLAFITMEDFLSMPSKYTMPQSSDQSRLIWGSSTVKGLAFGETERKQLAMLGYADENPMVATLPSYNEIMLRHRMVHVPHWAGTGGSNVKDAIHTVCSSLQHLTYLNQLADQYGWSEMRQELRKRPLADLSFAAADLGRTSPILRETAGFDWGSCAWRHCGALADAQEAVDELDFMLGVLEPFEARFCIDIVERSLRDILAVVDWSQAAPEDKKYYEELPNYESIFRDENGVGANGDAGSSSPRSVDDAYLKALQELRVD